MSKPLSTKFTSDVWSILIDDQNDPVQLPEACSSAEGIVAAAQHHEIPDDWSRSPTLSDTHSNKQGTCCIQYCAGSRHLFKFQICGVVCFLPNVLQACILRDYYSKCKLSALDCARCRQSLELSPASRTLSFKQDQELPLPRLCWSHDAENIQPP